MTSLEGKTSVSVMKNVEADALRFSGREGRSTSRLASYLRLSTSYLELVLASVLMIGGVEVLFRGPF